MARNTGKTDDVAVIKKYLNRRLYNTATSSYVTLNELGAMVRSGEEFVVYDAKSGEDITRSVLTQIILEEDGKGRNLLPISFLRQIIGYYDDSLQGLLPRYLELSMAQFEQNQDRIRQAMMAGAWPGFFPAAVEEMARQNMALFEKATASFFGAFQEDGPPSENAEPAAASPEDVKSLEQEIEALKKRLDALSSSQHGD